MESIDKVNEVRNVLRTVMSDMFELDTNMDNAQHAINTGISIRKRLKECQRVLQDARVEVITRRKEVQKGFQLEACEARRKADAEIAELEARLKHLKNNYPS